MQDDLLVHRLGRFFRHPHHSKNILRVGDQSLACANARTALQYLGYKGDDPAGDPQQFTEELATLVERFQRDVGNKVADGQVGPNTRRHLVQRLLERYSPAIFERMGLRGPRGKPTVFLSYASEDVRKVEKLDQWLRDKGVWVVRDANAFVPGQEIEQNIRFAVSTADKIVAVYSKQSSKKDWPGLEIALARGA
jgi:hypothetical protein